MSEARGFSTSRISSRGSAALAVARSEISPKTMNFGLSIRRSTTMSISRGMRMAKVINAPSWRVTLGPEPHPRRHLGDLARALGHGTHLEPLTGNRGDRAADAALGHGDLEEPAAEFLVGDVISGVEVCHGAATLSCPRHRRRQRGRSERRRSTDLAEQPDAGDGHAVGLQLTDDHGAAAFAFDPGREGTPRPDQLVPGPARQVLDQFGGGQWVGVTEGDRDIGGQPPRPRSRLRRRPRRASG